jgi:site-specific DNA-methyltransferase (adenine-specific)
MPKRPPRLVADADLAVPADLARVRAPHLALERPDGSRLWLADAEVLLGALPDGVARLAVCDPPYAIAKAEWDEFASLEAYVDWCDRWLAELERVLADDGTAYVCGFSEILAEIKVRSAKRFGGGCRWLVWAYKNKANLGRDWGRSHESILCLRKSRRFVMNVDAVRVPYNGHTTRYPERVQAVNSQYGGARARRDTWVPNPLGAKPRDVFDIPILCNGMVEKTPHPTQKPAALIERLVLASSDPGDVVVDPFAGAGTTAVVAAAHGRRFIVGDRDPRYVGLARARLGEAHRGAVSSLSPSPRRSAP